MKKFLLGLQVLAILLLGSCNKNNEVFPLASAQLAGRGFVYEDSMAGTPTASSRSMVYGEMEAGSADSALGANIPEDYERKLVRRAYVRIRVENLEASDQEIESLMNQYEAYSASTSAEENSRNYSIRVPSHFYEAFLGEMDGMGRMLSRHENTEDVTLRYYDLEGRLATRKELLKTYQSYLGRANNIEEMLAVEAKISELHYDIEHTGVMLRNLANQVDYSTIDLYILGPVAAGKSQGVTFGERIKQLFGGFGGFLSSVAVILLGIVIYGIPVLVLLVVLYWLLFGKVGLAKKLINKIK